MEKLINTIITQSGEEHNINIFQDSAEVGIYIEIDTKERELSLGAYISYDSFKECINGKESIVGNDIDYSLIKKFFFKELNHYLFEQVKRLQNCVA